MKEHIIETDATKEEKEEALKNDKVQTFLMVALPFLSNRSWIPGARYCRYDRLHKRLETS